SLDNAYHSQRKGGFVSFADSISIYALKQGDLTETEQFCHPYLAQTKIAVSPLRSDNSRLCFFSTSDKIYSFRIDTSGVNVLTGDEMSFNIEYPNIPLDEIMEDETIRVRGEMELIRLNNGNYRIAVPYIHVGEIGVVELNP